MKLEDFKDLLISGNRAAEGWGDDSRSRFYSFKAALDYLIPLSSASVLEIGSCQSFVNGGLPGCMVNNAAYWVPNDPKRWDWGAGCFTLMFGLYGFDLTTVDIRQEALDINKVMTDSLGITCRHVLSDSVSFLQSTNKTYDLIYLDAGHFSEFTTNHQLSEAQTIVRRNLLNKGGLILLDDVICPAKRSDKSIPYLLSSGFDLVFEGYQYLLRKHEVV